MSYQPQKIKWRPMNGELSNGCCELNSILYYSVSNQRTDSLFPTPILQNHTHYTTPLLSSNSREKTSFTTWIFTKCVYSEIIKHLMICRGAQNSPPNSVVWYVMRLIFFRLGINESVQQQAYDYLNRTFLLIFKKAIEICFLW